jgi:hypothetical protein
MVTDQELKNFVGNKFDYYKSNWGFISFNPSAAIFGPFWFFYRKMNLCAFVLIFFNLFSISHHFLSDLEELPSIDVLRINNLWFIGYFFSSMVISGCFGNSIYKLYVYSRIKQLKKKYSGDDYLQILGIEGGTSLSFLFYVFVFIFWITILGIIALLAFLNTPLQS